MTEAEIIEELQAHLEAALREIDRLRAQVAQLERREALASLVVH